MSNGGFVLVYKHEGVVLVCKYEGDCESDEVIVAEVLKERDISEDDEVAEMKLEDVLAGIGVSSLLG